MAIGQESELMTEPRNSGNRADEVAEAERGADFSSINRSGEPTPTEDVDVTVERAGRDVVVHPNKRLSEQFRKDVGEFRESAKDVLAAQIFDDPTMAQSALEDLARRKSERGSLIYYAITSSFAAAPAGDRLVVQRTTMESAYSCGNCKGKGHIEKECPTCRGAKVEIFHGELEDYEKPCRSCQVIGYANDSGKKVACGHVPCDSCNSSGWAGGVVIPEVSQTEPCWGIVVTVGPQCVNYFPGELVQYSRYAGHTNTTKTGEAYTTMRETEILWHLKELRS